MKWSLRNNVNFQQSAILLAMNHVANNKDKFLNNFYLKSKRSGRQGENRRPGGLCPAGERYASE
ncbi:MAG: hypothetical protein IPG58_08170 [Acidobacteria bacterium]|nr:hypothetical protein [Acidobacteriota bacterium]